MGGPRAGHGAISFDAVKMIALARLEQRVPRLDLQFYLHLPRANVGRTDPRSYMGLLASRHSSDGSSSMSDPMMPLPAIEAEPTSVPPAVLLANHLKALKLPSFAREYEKLALEAAQGRADYPRYLLRLCELERMDRERRMVERRIRMAIPHTKSFDTFDFAAQPSPNKALVLELARGEWIERRRNVIALGPSGTGKTHTASR
jgi:hypothetical protein